MTNLIGDKLPELTASVVIVVFLTLALSVIVLLIRNLATGSGQCSVRVNNRNVIQGVWGDTLLRVLNNEGIPIPSGCAGAGTCGLCRVKLTDNLPRPTPAEKTRLGRNEIRDGTRLACQVKIHGELNVSVPDSILVADEWLCTVSGVRQLSPLIKEITLDLPTRSTLEFEPGSYVQVTAPAFQLPLKNIPVSAGFEKHWAMLNVDALTAASDEPVSRAYSLANKPEQTKTVVLLIRLALPPLALMDKIPAGKVSSWLFSLKPGDQVTVGGPFGDFYLRPSEREMVLVGGGVGMAPLWSILHQELNSKRKRSVRFFYGARAQWDVFYLEELSRLADEHERFEFVVSLSEPSNTLPWEGPTGFVHEVLERDFLNSHPAPDDCDFYLCGPPLMQQAVTTALDSAGVEMTSVFADSFGA